MPEVVEEPTTQSEIEAFLTAKITAGDADVGLYDCGMSHVLVEWERSASLGRELKFSWYPDVLHLDDLLPR